MNERFQVCTRLHSFRHEPRFLILWDWANPHKATYYTIVGQTLFDKLRKGSTPEDLGLIPDTNQEPDE